LYLLERIQRKQTNVGARSLVPERTTCRYLYLLERGTSPMEEDPSPMEEDPSPMEEDPSQMEEDPSPIEEEPSAMIPSTIDLVVLKIVDFPPPMEDFCWSNNLALN
jgi:hypothetical protein